MKPFVPRFLPSFDRDVPVCANNPLGNQYPRWLFYHSVHKSATIKHPLLPLFGHLLLDGPINSNINWLAQPSAATRDMMDLDSKRLDPIYNGSHHVDAICIQDQQGNNTRFPAVFPWNKNEVDPYVHHFLIHPRLFLDRCRSSWPEMFAIPCSQFGHQFCP